MRLDGLQARGILADTDHRHRASNLVVDWCRGHQVWYFSCHRLEPNFLAVRTLLQDLVPRSRQYFAALFAEKFTHVSIPEARLAIAEDLLGIHVGPEYGAIAVQLKEQIRQRRRERPEFLGSGITFPLRGLGRLLACRRFLRNSMPFKITADVIVELRYRKPRKIRIRAATIRSLCAAGREEHKRRNQDAAHEEPRRPGAIGHHEHSAARYSRARHDEYGVGEPPLRVGEEATPRMGKQNPHTAPVAAAPRLKCHSRIATDCGSIGRRRTPT
ncbi:MAG: hypothetical protein MZW92_16440 [Comamonadaceae bacterium]|nr:hypothetical protein [Comamonadaceae bacterium]